MDSRRRLNKRSEALRFRYFASPPCVDRLYGDKLSPHPSGLKLMACVYASTFQYAFRHRKIGMQPRDTLVRLLDVHVGDFSHAGRGRFELHVHLLID